MNNFSKLSDHNLKIKKVFFLNFRDLTDLSIIQPNEII